MPRDVQMTPGNKDPGRYRKSTLSVAVAALVAAAGGGAYLYQDEPDEATIALYEQFLDEKEGNRTKAYLDSEGIATVCRGLTRIYGRKVTLADNIPPEECRRLNRAHVVEALHTMRKLVGPDVWKTMSPAARVGTSSFCVTNIGPAKCEASTFMRELRQGPARRNEACAQITNWIRDGGRDCRKAGSNCQGQPIRRMQEDELCLS